MLDRNSDLNDPESVERYVFKKELKNKSRINFFNAYNHYCKQNEVDWKRPRLIEEIYPLKIST